MIVHAAAHQLVDSGPSQMKTQFQPPPEAVGVQAQIVVLDGEIWCVVNWTELDADERKAAEREDLERSMGLHRG